MPKKPLFFYGWVIVAVSITGMVLVYGTRHSFSVFFPPVLDEFGWNRGSTALMLSLNLLVYGFTAPLAGSLCDRWKPRTVISIGIIILSVATASCAFAQELWHFYLSFGVLMPVGTAFVGWPVLAPTLSNWFEEKRGLAMGAGQAGGGLSYTYGIFVERIISVLGWRYAFFVIAAIVVVVLLPLYLFFFHYRPENKGLMPYGASKSMLSEDKSLSPATAYSNATTSWTLSQAIRTHQLWLLFVSNSLFWGFGCYTVIAHQVKYAQDLGYSSLFAASIFGLFGIFMTIGQFSCGISDRIGREKTVTFAIILSIIALVSLLLVKGTSNSGFLYLYATCLGFGSGLCAPTMYAGIADIFYGRHYGSINGLMLTGFGLGGVAGPWFGGFIHDLTGSYTWAIIAAMIAFGISCLIFWIAAPRKAKQIRAKLE